MAISSQTLRPGGHWLYLQIYLMYNSAQMGTLFVVGRRLVLAERIRQKPDTIRVWDDTECAVMAQADTECLALTQDSAVYSYVLDSYPL